MKRAGTVDCVRAGVSSGDLPSYRSQVLVVGVRREACRLHSSLQLPTSSAALDCLSRDDNSPLSNSGVEFCRVPGVEWKVAVSFPVDRALVSINTSC